SPASFSPAKKTLGELSIVEFAPSNFSDFLPSFLTVYFNVGTSGQTPQNHQRFTDISGYSSCLLVELMISTNKMKLVGHRPRRGEDDYMPGNITEIELHNFMTFSKLTCKPGSRLNLVIGPNGSGKSSLVCAIALGLGGEPQLLGRASSIGAFVKRGEESGYIKISLRGETKEDQLTIVRKIDTRNKSEWIFNGKAVPKKNVTDIIQRFNIQVNNLTQVSSMSA
ncbi:hypothetical protein MTR67_004137, partial [Solanum verrucosum]